MYEILQNIRQFCFLPKYRCECVVDVLYIIAKQDLRRRECLHRGSFVILWIFVFVSFVIVMGVFKREEWLVTLLDVNVGVPASRSQAPHHNVVYDLICRKF